MTILKSWGRYIFLKSASRSMNAKMEKATKYLLDKNKENISENGAVEFLNKLLEQESTPVIEKTFKANEEKLIKKMIRTYQHETQPSAYRNSYKNVMPRIDFSRYQFRANSSKLNEDILRNEEDIVVEKDKHEINVIFSSATYNKFIRRIKNEKDLIKGISSLLSEEKESLLHLMNQLGFDNQIKKSEAVSIVISTTFIIEQAIQDCRRWTKKKNLKLDEDGEIRALYNILNLYLHHVIETRSFLIPRRKRYLYFLAAVLHPLQDDYLDRGHSSAEGLKAIENAVRNKHKYNSNDCSAEKVVYMVKELYKCIPRKKVSQMEVILSSLYEWQLESQKQQNEELEDEELLEISMKKGGYAFAFYGCLVVPNFTAESFNHFFMMGALFQLLDDLHDLEEDLRSESITIWTRAYHKGQWADVPMNGLIALQHLFEERTRRVPDMKSPLWIRLIELIGFRYDLFRFCSMHLSQFSPLFEKEFKEVHPISIVQTQKFFRDYQIEESLITMEDTLKNITDILSSLDSRNWLKKVIYGKRMRDDM
ncbi:hypothetical protein [Alkalicoccus chagannorensis]|uniref:hypothetical protein n=1 Tax=Alkalicoccus chagannorensis TaxID=427072 RepID=UPI0004111CD7|nr:hypothetical protein [Alkalicoccus chagannorensis]